MSAANQVSIEMAERPFQCRTFTGFVRRRDLFLHHVEWQPASQIRLPIFCLFNAFFFFDTWFFNAFPFAAFFLNLCGFVFHLFNSCIRLSLCHGDTPPNVKYDIESRFAALMQIKHAGKAPEATTCLATQGAQSFRTYQFT
jgi:hypothetical protein